MHEEVHVDGDGFARASHASAVTSRNCSWRDMKPVLHEVDEQACMTFTSETGEETSPGLLKTEQTSTFGVYIQGLSKRVTLGTIYEVFHGLCQQNSVMMSEESKDNTLSAGSSSRPCFLLAADGSHGEAHGCGTCLKKPWLCSACLHEAHKRGTCGGLELCALCQAFRGTNLIRCMT